MGFLVDRTTPHSWRLRYVNSLKWNGHREIGTVQTFLTDEARYANIPFSWNGYEIVAQASVTMPIQRSYRLPQQFPIDDIQIDCGVYLFLMTLCIKNGEHLGTLTPAVVHAA